MPNQDPFASDAAAPLVEETSLSLLRRVQAWEVLAWERFVQLYGALVYRWCRRAGLDSPDAADVAQDVFLSTAQSIGRFRRHQNSGSLRAWLRTITRNKISDYFRVKARQPQASAADAGFEENLSAETSSCPADDDEQEVSCETGWLHRRAVELIERDFSEATRRAFWAVVVANRQPREVAKELGISINAVYVAKSRVLARLRDEFADVLE
jgi:RNA polymerase sigma-70 factor (ECF subfamily)